MATGEPATRSSMPARSFCGSGSSNQRHAELGQAVGHLQRRRQGEDLAAVHHQLDSTGRAGRAARPASRGRVASSGRRAPSPSSRRGRAAAATGRGARPARPLRGRRSTRTPAPGRAPGRAGAHRPAGRLPGEVPQRDLDAAAGLRPDPGSPRRRRVNRPASARPDARPSRSPRRRSSGASASSTTVASTPANEQP